MAAEGDLDIAIEHQRAGRLEEAASLYEKILRDHPDHPDALHLLGTVELERGQKGRATDLVRRAILARPGESSYHNTLGLALAQLGDHQEARRHLIRALELDPDLAPAHHNLGKVLEAMGNMKEAVAHHGRALALRPDYANASLHLGLAQRKLGDLQAASFALEEASRLSPDFAEGWAALGVVRQEQGHWERSVEAFRQAARCLPEDPVVLCRLGGALLGAGKTEAALESFNQAIDLDPECADAYYGLGCGQLEQGEYAASIPHLVRALELNPTFGPGRHNLGRALFELGQVEEAVSCFEQAQEDAPGPFSLGAIATMLPGSPAADNRSILEARRAWAQAVSAESLPAKSRPQLKAKTRLRLGYVSSFFHRANWMKPVWGLINAHDRSLFEIYLFDDESGGGLGKSGYRSQAGDRVHPIHGLSNPEAARLIAKAKIDILIDLNGYSARERLPIYASRPGSIVVGWFGWYGTTGFSCFDYLIGDEQAIPREEEEFYLERIVRVPGSYMTFEVSYPVPGLVPPPCRHQGSITFGSLASGYKLTPQTVASWSEILKGVPGSRLLLRNASLGSAGNREFVMRCFTDLGILPDRLTLLGPAEHFSFLETYNQIDVALDPFPYNGGTTTAEAIWQGVPVATFWGDRWASRTSASILRNSHLAGFVADNLEQHTSQTIELVRDPGTPHRLEELRLTMRERLRSSLVCDTAGFARAMEEAYWTIWEEWCAKP